MIERLLDDEAADLYRADLPSPVHMPNLITFEDELLYERYGLLAMPAVLLSGGRPLWLGDGVETYAGRAWDRFMVVTYPTHRRLVLMTSNPYYRFINRYRERVVEYFEIGFSHPVETDDNGTLGEHDLLLVAQLPGDPVEESLASARKAFEGTPAEFVYATEEVRPLEHADEAEKGSDPHPLTHKLLACFAVPSLDAAESATLEDEFEDYGLTAFERR